MASSLVFTARRREPVLVTPSSPTPHEFKPLSDIDDQQGLRRHISSIKFYREHPSMSGRDPATILRSALAKALVFYYPYAGRLIERPDRKLIIECTGEGALFVEADADVRLDQFGTPPQPPFPCLDQLIYGVKAAAQNFLTYPLLTFQVTRFQCGGFACGQLDNHVAGDGFGMAQMQQAVADIARGADAPKIQPVWARELLTARNPPHPTHAHPAYDELAAPDGAGTGEAVLRMFFFGPKEISELRRRLPPQLQRSSRFEVVTACLWRSRTAALGAAPDEEVRLRFVVSARDKCNPPLPAGYYGNTFVFPIARAAAGELASRPLSYAVELVKEARASVTEGCLQSLADFLVMKGRPHFATARTFLVSDATRVGFDKIDFGWGAPVYGGLAYGGGTAVDVRSPSIYSACRNGDGVEGIVAPVSLPAPAMERFVAEIEGLINGGRDHASTKIIFFEGNT